MLTFNGAETNCRIAHILGILLMNSCNTDILFSNYYHLQSVRFELSKKTRDSLEITTVNSLGSDVPCDTTKCSLTIKMDKISQNFTDQRINMG